MDYESSKNKYLSKYMRKKYETQPRRLSPAPTRGNRNKYQKKWSSCIGSLNRNRDVKREAILICREWSEYS